MARRIVKKPTEPVEDNTPQPNVKVEILMYEVVERNAEGGLSEDVNPKVALTVYQNHNQWIVLDIAGKEYVVNAQTLIDAVSLVVK